jgi:predicted transcriptional regulator
MKIKQATIMLSALVLILIVGGCFAASLEQQKKFAFTYSPQEGLQVFPGLTGLKAITIDKIVLLGTPSATSFTVNAPAQPVASNSTRMQIYNYINQNPGVQFRAICAGLTLPVGLAQFHIAVLVKSGLVSFVRDGKYKRFFVSKKFSKKQMAAIIMLRHKTAKRIFEILLNKKQLSHGKLASEVCISSQALTWQMKSLKNTEFVLEVNEGLKTIYSIDKTSEHLLKSYLAIVD